MRELGWMTGRFWYFDRTLRSSAAEINAALEWLRELAARHAMGEDPLFRLELCATELLANVAEHGYAGSEGEIRLELFLDKDTATLTVVDTGVAFDTQRHTLPPLPDSLINAPIGGFGLRLVRRFADSLDYERLGGCNRSALRIGGRPLVPRKPRRRNHDAPGTDSGRIAADQRHTADRRGSLALSNTVLFRGVSQEVIDGILPHCELRTCDPEEVLLCAGEYHRCVLVNIEGRLRVQLDGAGSQFHLELAAGESVGELSVANGNPVSAEVVAATASRLLVIPEPVFLESMLAVPRISRNLVTLMSERTRRSDTHILTRVRAAMELEALQRELDFARQIQSSMLPVAPLFPAALGIQGRGFMRAARHVGGDFYDAFPLSDGRVFVAIGDVCSKGTPAALYMVRTLTLLRSEAVRVERDAISHLGRLATRCNDLLNESNEAQQFVTLFCAIVDVGAGCLYFVNAGHNPPLLRVAAAEPVFLREPRNPIAGIIPGLKYSAGSCEFPPGSLCVLYTDGVTEAENSAGAMFEDKALREIVGRAEITNADTCVDTIIAAVDGFAGEHPQADDITVLAIHRP